MQVNANYGTSGASDIPPARPKASQPGPAQDQADFEGMDQLPGALSQTSDVRPGKVAQARSLIADPSYPPDELLSRISNILTGVVQSPTDSGGE
jgi:hypothetical protein